jgi:hypothetical protein
MLEKSRHTSFSSITEGRQMAPIMPDVRTGFSGNEFRGGNIPRVQAPLIEPLQSPARHPTDVKRR